MFPGALLAPPTSQAPNILVNLRKGRYRGEDFCLAMNRFTPHDQALIRQTYEFLEGLFVVLQRQHLDGTAETLARAQDFVADLDPEALLRSIRGLGVESLFSREDELMAKTVHDLRGGALSALLGELQLAQLRPRHQINARQLFFLTRDHLKIMRNALLGLDDPKRQADLLPKMHSVDLIAEKWQHALVGSVESRARLEVVSDFHGNIAECCVEFGALDRVLYNLVNNACRHTASGEVKLMIQAQPEAEEQPENLCFCVSNPVDARDEGRLAGHGNLHALFEPGVSSTGSGFGLTIALDFVTNAFGLQRRAQSLEGGYIGLECAGGEFRVWFHWPVAADV